MSVLKPGRGQVACAPVAIGRCFEVAFCLSLLLAVQYGACGRTSKRQSPQQETMPGPDINDVLRAHDNELLAIPGVVGVYVGLLDDGKTSCLKVMVVKKTLDLEQRLPRSLEGYPVVIEESGIIRPMHPD